jgi:hypothetical protein
VMPWFVQEPGPTKCVVVSGSHLTSSARTRKGNRNGKTIQQSRKTPSSSRLSSEKEERRQSGKTLTKSP